MDVSEEPKADSSSDLSLQDATNTSSVLLDFTASFKSSSTVKAEKPWVKTKPWSELSPPEELPPQIKSSKKDRGDKENSSDWKEEDHPQSYLHPMQTNREEIDLSEYLVEERDKTACEGHDNNGIASLNSTLDQYGYSSLVLEDPESICTVIQSLLRDIRVNQESIKAYEIAAHRATVDCKRLQNEKDSLKIQVQCLKQDNSALENKLSVCTAQSKKDRQRYDTWVRELQVSVAKLEGQQKAWQASLNRKEGEYERLQKRMQMLQSQKDRTIKRAMEMSPPPPPRDKVPESKDSDGAEEVSLEGFSAKSRLETLVEASQSRKAKLLLSENERLRTSLSSLQTLVLNKFSSMLSQMARHVKEENHRQSSVENSVDSLRLSPLEFNLPANELAKRIEALKERMFSLTQVQETTNNRDFSCTEELSYSEILDRLEQAKQIIAEQDNLLQVSLFGNTSDHAQDIDIDIDVDRMRTERQLMEEERDLESLRLRLQADQDRLLQEAQKLDEERAQFEAERFEFQTSSLGKEGSAFAISNTSDSVSTPPVPSRYRKRSGQGAPLSSSSSVLKSLPVPATPATKELLEDIFK